MTEHTSMEEAWPGTDQLRPLLDRLPVEDPVKSYGSAALEGDSLDKKAIGRLAATLHDGREVEWRRKAAAALTLGTVTPLTEEARGAVRALCGLLDGDFDPPANQWTRRTSRACFTVIGSWTVGFLVILLGIGFISGLPGPPRWLAFVMGFLILCGGLLFPIGLFAPIVSGILTERRTYAVREAAVLALGRLNDPVAVSSLARMVTESPRRKRQRALRSLLELLPRLQAEHAGTFPRRTVPDLCHLLTDHPETAGVVLQALEVVGDEQAIRTVTSMVTSAGTEDLREKARRTLIVLTERAERNKKSAHLLRPAADFGEDALLRPATTNHEANPDELLRPVSGQ